MNVYDKMTFSFGYHHSGFGNGFNAWAAPYFDRQAQQAKLKYTDFSVISSGGSMERELTREELFEGGIKRSRRRMPFQ
ncbi:hypothetical protein [Frankia sp. CiP3]|uniref:hypothetical protein n=1 Tax=Frankia sp. CiP3 TaxID=2880971 RepID=UPI001EF6B1B1|nr:hypothetical protein [Frankia sp. CiP3]